MRRVRGLYLFDAALGDAEHVDEVARDQQHGRHSHEPANHLAPQRVHILAQGQRGHLNGTEGKHTLQLYNYVISPVNQRQNENSKHRFGDFYVEKHLG